MEPTEEAKAPTADDLAPARQIQGGDEDAFIRLVSRHHAGFLKLAMTWVHWRASPSAWPATPESSALSAELRNLPEPVVTELPETQRAVLLLRDVESPSARVGP
jgi:hypothetical protein